jgi:uncharacterized protein YbjT (DUF2867 family)
MRIAVVGATGLAGRHVVRALRRQGHEPVKLSRASGVDIQTGAGLVEALDGVQAVVDVSNTPAQDADGTREFFGTGTANLVAAERKAGVGHHVVLSIVGVDRVPGNAHYAGKRRQEEVALAGPVPVTVVRATQFHDFPAQVVGWVRQGDVAPVPPLLMQPIDLGDLGEVLAETATLPGRDTVREVAGPQTEDLVDMARRTFAARGENVRLVPTWRGMFGVAMAGEVLLPGPDAWLGETSFDAWLAAGARSDVP